MMSTSQIPTPWGEERGGWTWLHVRTMKYTLLVKSLGHHIFIKSESKARKVFFK